MKMEEKYILLNYENFLSLREKKSKEALQKIINILNVVDDNRHVDFPSFFAPSPFAWNVCKCAAKMSKTKKKLFLHIFIWYEKK